MTKIPTPSEQELTLTLISPSIFHTQILQVNIIGKQQNNFHFSV